MALYPGAVFRPTPFGGRVTRNRQGRGMLHVAVSKARSLPPSSGKATWHFYIAFDGYCEQYVDTEYRAYGGADGNDDQLIIETAGGTGSSAQLNAEKWTPAQAERIADIMRWEASQPGGAPLELLPDARPGRRGWGPHRLGIKHSAGPRPGWWQPGSELWSSALGKECPGDAKVAQIPSILALARGGNKTGGFLMALDDKQQDNLAHDAANGRAAAVNTQEAVGRVELKLWGMESLLSKIAADGANDLTEASVTDAARKGVEAGIGNIAATVRQVVLDTLGEDNTDQADAIVEALADRLKPTA